MFIFDRSGKLLRVGRQANFQESEQPDDMNTDVDTSKQPFAVYFPDSMSDVGYASLLHKYLPLNHKVH